MSWRKCHAASKMNTAFIFCMYLLCVSTEEYELRCMDTLSTNGLQLSASSGLCHIKCEDQASVSISLASKTVFLMDQVTRVTVSDMDTPLLSSLYVLAVCIVLKKTKLMQALLSGHFATIKPPQLWLLSPKTHSESYQHSVICTCDIISQWKEALMLFLERSFHGVTFQNSSVRLRLPSSIQRLWVYLIIWIITGLCLMPLHVKGNHRFVSDDFGLCRGPTQRDTNVRVVPSDSTCAYWRRRFYRSPRLILPTIPAFIQRLDPNVHIEMYVLKLYAFILIDWVEFSLQWWNYFRGRKCHNCHRQCVQQTDANIRTPTAFVVDSFPCKLQFGSPTTIASKEAFSLPWEFSIKARNISTFGYD